MLQVGSTNDGPVPNTRQALRNETRLTGWVTSVDKVPLTPCEARSAVTKQSGRSEAVMTGRHIVRRDRSDIMHLAQCVPQDDVRCAVDRSAANLPVRTYFYRCDVVRPETTLTHVQDVSALQRVTIVSGRRRAAKGELCSGLQHLRDRKLCPK